MLLLNGSLINKKGVVIDCPKNIDTTELGQTIKLPKTCLVSSSNM